MNSLINLINGPKRDFSTSAGAVDDLDPLHFPDLYENIIFRRVSAYFIDVVIIGILIALTSFSLGLLGVVTFGATWGIMGIVLFLIPFAYHTILIGGDGSATFGMRVMELEVRNWMGGHPEYFQAGLQTFLFYASIALTAWLILLIAFFSDSRRCLHDLFSGTVVVNRVNYENGTEDTE